MTVKCEMHFFTSAEKGEGTTLPTCSISPRSIQTNSLEHLVFYVPSSISLHSYDEDGRTF